jgi:hypothetical protein
MPSVKHIRTEKRGARIWTMRRKLMGNFLPALIGLPFAGVGIAVVVRSLDAAGLGICWVIGSVAAMWLSVNFLGLFENSRMRREMSRRLMDRDRALPTDALFVGCATPTYAGWLDPHEDVGFLCIEADRIIFWGDSLELVVLKSETIRIRFRPNVHSAAGLGRWISIEGLSEGTPIRLCVEPRERRTLLGNLRLSKALKVKLDRWLKAD